MCDMCSLKILSSNPSSWPPNFGVSHLAGILSIPLLESEVDLLGQRLGRKAFHIFKTSMKEGGRELAWQEPADHGTQIMAKWLERPASPMMVSRGTDFTHNLGPFVKNPDLGMTSGLMTEKKDPRYIFWILWGDSETQDWWISCSPILYPSG